MLKTRYAQKAIWMFRLIAEVTVNNFKRNYAACSFIDCCLNLIAVAMGITSCIFIDDFLT